MILCKFKSVKPNKQTKMQKKKRKNFFCQILADITGKELNCSEIMELLSITEKQ